MQAPNLLSEHDVVCTTKVAGGDFHVSDWCQTRRALPAASGLHLCCHQITPNASALPVMPRTATGCRASLCCIPGYTRAEISLPLVACADANKGCQHKALQRSRTACLLYVMSAAGQSLVGVNSCRSSGQQYSRGPGHLSRQLCISRAADFNPIHHCVHIAQLSLYRGPQLIRCVQICGHHEQQALTRQFSGGIPYSCTGCAKQAVASSKRYVVQSHPRHGGTSLLCGRGEPDAPVGVH